MSRHVLHEDSLFYRFYSFMREFWGFGVLEHRTSLCPFFHTMFWLSLLTLVFSPLMIAGWMMLKVYRFLYTRLASKGWDRILDFFDNTLSPLVDKASNKMNKSGGITSLMVCLSVVATLAAGIGLCYIGFMIIYKIIINIFVWPVALWNGLLWIFYGIFMGFALFGELLYLIGWSVFWLVTQPIVWSIAAYVVVIAAACFLLVMGIWKFMGTKLGSRIKDFLTYKLNGFDAARKARKQKLEEAEKSFKIHSEDDSSKDGKSKLAKILQAPLLWIISLGEKILDYWQKEDPWGNKVVGPVGMLWAWIKAIKHKVCPTLEIIDSGVLESAKRTLEEVGAAGGEDALTINPDHRYEYQSAAPSGNEGIGKWYKNKYPSVISMMSLAHRYLDDDTRPLKLRNIIAKYVMGLVSEKQLLTETDAYMKEAWDKHKAKKE